MVKFIRRLLLIVLFALFSSAGLYAQVSINDSTFSTLKEAFDAINAGTYTDTVYVKINGDTEESARATLKASGSGGANYTTVIIYPTAVSTILGNIGSGMIQLEDADNVVFDGRINRTGNTNSLTIQNDASASTAVIWLSKTTAGDGCKNVTIRNLNIIGGAPATTTVHGILVSSTTLATGGLGNDNLKVLNNSIYRSGYGIRVIGLSTTLTTGIEIRNNDIGNNATSGDGVYYGIDVSYSTGTIIDNNRVSVSGTTLYNIYLRNSNSCIISNNLSENSVVSAGFYGCYLSTSTNNTLTNNKFINNSSTSLYGAYFSSSGTNIITDYLIANHSSTSTIYGIYSSSSNGNEFTRYYINNAIGTTTVYGTYFTSSTNNKIFESGFTNITGGGTGTFYGAYHTSSGTAVYDNVKFENLTGNAITYGIYLTSSANCEIKNCNISNVRSTSTSATQSAYGIYVNTSSNGTVIVNNSISGIYDGVNKTNVSHIPSGIMLFGSTNHLVYNNSVNMYGVASTGNTVAGMSSAFTMQGAATTCDVKNNTFVNTMTNDGPSYKSYAVYFVTTAPLTGGTVDYNNYFVSGPNGVLSGIATTDYTNLTALKNAAAGKNTNSINVDPIYNSNSNLRPYLASPLVGQGTPILTVTLDQVGTTRSATTPTLGAFETAGDYVAPTFTFIPLQNTTSTANRSLAVNILDNTLVNNTTFKPRLYYKRKYNTNTYVDNTNATNGWKYVEATSVVNNVYTFDIDYSKVYGGVTQGNVIQYFIVAQDDASPANVALSSGKLATNPTNLALSSANFPISDLSTDYAVSASLSGVIQVGQGQTYTSLTQPGGLFELLQISVLTGDLDIQIVSDLEETGEYTLEQIATSGGSWNLKIYPTGNYTVSGAAYPALITLDDADRVTIDGRINATGSTNALTINNLSTSGAVVWIKQGVKDFANGARNNTIKYCNVIGGSPTVTTSFGIVVGGSTLSGGSKANINTVIDNNNIYRCYYGIRANGEAGFDNYLPGLQITNNKFGNNGTTGDGHYYTIYNYYCDGNIIQNNRMQTNATTVIYNVYNGYSQNSIISNNIADGNSSSSSHYGIYDYYSNGSNVFDNEIANSSSTAFYGVTGYYSNQGTYNNNIIRNITGSSTFYVLYYYYGGSHNVTNNKLSNISNTSTTYGIYNGYSPNNTYSGNTLRNLYGGSTTYGFYGLGSAANNAANITFKNNIVDNIYMNGTATVGCAGLFFSTATDNSTIANNAISGIYRLNNSVSASYLTAGIRLASSAGIKVYHNSVNMYGTNYATNNIAGHSTALLVENSTATGLDIRNNTFSNSYESFAGSKAYSMIIVAAASLAGSTINYNNYYSSGSQAVLASVSGADVADFVALQTATALDVNSMSADPVFNGNNELVPFVGSPLGSVGIAIAEVPNDLTGAIRSLTAPTIGAYENIGDFVAPAISIVAIKNAGNNLNRNTTGTITDKSGIATGAFAPRIYFKKKTNNNTFIDNTNATNGWKYTTATGTAPDYTFEINTSLLNGGLAVGEEVEYFVIAQDNGPSQNVGFSSGEFATAPTSVDLVAANFPVSRINHSYKLLPSISGVIEVGEGKQYTSLTGPNGVFAAINNSILVGNLHIKLTSDLAEYGNVSLYEIPSDNVTPYTIYIYPTTEVVVQESASPALISFVDVDNLVFDGRINMTGNVNALTLENTASSTASCLWFGKAAGGDGANNVTVRNINIIGGTPSTSTVYGIVFGGSTSLTSAGNHNNVQILYNNFKRSYYGIRLYGSSSAYFTSPKIRFNTFGNNATEGDGHYYAMYVYYSSEALISHNTISILTTTTLYNMYLYYTVNALVYNNSLVNTSSSTYYGIYLSNGNNTQLYSNTISGNSASSTAYVIYPTSSSNANLFNNVISNNTFASTTYYFYINSGSGNITTSNVIENNTSSTHNGFYYTSSANGISENNITRNNNASSTIYAHYFSSSANAIANNNIVENNTTTSTAYGFYLSSSDTSNLNGNTVKSLYGGSSTYGMYITSSPGCKVIGNTISDIRQNAGSSTTYCDGIYVGTSSNNTHIVNNTVAGVFDATFKTTNTYIPSGIRIHGSTGHKIYYNSVNMFGTPLGTGTSAGASTALMIFTASTTGLDIQNNIFVNTMSGHSNYKPYTVYMTSATSLNSSTIQYNNYYFNGLNAKLGYIAADKDSLLDWKTTTAQDSGSISTNVEFNDDYNLAPFTTVFPGTPIAAYTSDIAGITRSTTTPSMGAYEEPGDYVAPMVIASRVANSVSISNKTITAEITDKSGIASAAYQPRLYYRKKSNVNGFIDNTPLSDGWKYTTGTGTAPNYTFTLDVSLLNGGLATGDEIEYFVVAQDQTAAHKVGSSSGNFANAPTSVQLVANNFPVYYVNHSYKIMQGISGIIEVGQGKQFANLTGVNGAFAYINQYMLNGDLHVKLTSDLTEPGTVALNQIDSDGSTPSTIYIYPTVEVNIVESVTPAIIKFNDADNVVVDGRINMQGAENSLSIENLTTSAACIWVARGTSSLANGANNVTIRNVNIVGASQTTSSSYGIVVGGGTSISGSGANDNVSILYNDIKRCYYGVRLYASSSARSNNFNISHNNFGNYGAPNDGHYYGVYTYYGNNGVVNNNYMSVKGTTTINAYYIYYTDNTQVNSNTLSNSEGTALYGVYSYYSNGNTMNNNLFSNNIASSTSNYVYASYSSNSVMSKNVCFNNTTSGNAFFVCASNGSGNNIADSNNVYDNTSGLHYTVYFTNCNINSASYNITRNNIATSGQMYAYVAGTAERAKFNYNLAENNYANSSSTAMGIYFGTSNLSEAVGNTIRNIYGGGNIYGIYLTTASDSKVLGNSISYLRQINATTTNLLNGIYIGDACDKSTVANNEVSGLYEAVHKTSVTYIPVGIRLNNSIGHRVYFNSVNLYGESMSTSTSNGATAAFLMASSNVKGCDIRNNVFVNSMTAPTGVNYKAYSAYLADSVNANTSTIEYNDYYVDGANGVLGYIEQDINNLATWKATTAKDSGSVSIDPQFNNNNNLRPFDGSPVIALGTPLLGFETDIVGDLRSATAPTLGAYEETGDFVPPSISFTPLGATSETTNRTITATVYDLNGVNATTNRPRIYFKKVNNQNTYNDNTPGTDGWKFSNGVGAGFNYSFTIDYNLINGGVNPGDEIEYFIVAQDNSPLALTGASSGEFAIPLTTTNLTASHFPVVNVVNEYKISIPMAGVIEVGEGKIYTSLTNTDGLFAVINGSLLVGDLQIKITSDLEESGDVALKEIATENNLPYTISIYPTGNYTISGNAGTLKAVLPFSGADRVTIDGRINRTGSSNALTIQNNTTIGASVWITNGTRNFTLRNTNIVGASPTSTTCFGFVASSPSSFTTGLGGQDSIKLLYNNFSRVYYGARAHGLSGTEVNGMRVIGNKFGNNGVSGDGHYYSTYFYYTKNSIIDSNIVDCNNSGYGYGIYNYYGFNNQVRYNNVKIVTTSYVYGVYTAYGSGNNVSYNSITNCNSSVMYGMYCSNNTTTTFANNTISNNVGTSSAYYIYAYYGVSATYNNNTISNNTNGGVMYPLYSYYGSNNNFNNNKILNNATTAASAVYGAYVYYSSGNNFNGNTFSGLTGLSTTAGMYIYSGSTSTLSSDNIVRNNIFENINKQGTSTTTYAAGISIGSNANNNTLFNNRISGVKDNVAQSTSAYIPSGIRINGSTGHKIYHNTISLEGINNVVTTSAGVAINNATMTNVEFKNNVISNTMTGPTNTKSYAFYVGVTGVTGVTSDFNNIFAGGAQGILGYFNGADISDLTAWQTASALDLNSKATDPMFVGNGDYRPLTVSPLLGGGTPIATVTTDMLGAARSTTAPTIGAYENGLVIGIPLLVTPANGSTNISLTPTLTWGTVFTATGYVLQVSTNSNFTSFVYNGAVAGLNHTLATPLSYNTLYYWRVSATGAGPVQGDWSTVWSFRTQLPPLGIPNLTLPANNATNVAVNPSFSWSSVSTATGYTLQISTDAAFATVNITENVTGTSKAITGLTNGTQYYWRVRANRNTEEGNWSVVRMFTTIAPVGIPTLNLPADLATAVSIAPTLTWNTVSTATGYKVQVSTDAAFTTTLVDETLTATNKALSGLNYSTEYFWRVKAIRNAEESDWSTARKFTTESMPLLAPVLVSPIDDATNVATAPTLTWNSAATALEYKVQVSTDNTFATTLVDETLTATSKDLTGLANSTEYFWRVKSIRNTDESVWSTIWSFTTTSGIVNQTFTLVNGWNMVSANVEATNPDLSTIMAPLSGNLQQMKNVYGQIYAPPFTNSLSTWNKYHAYQVRLTTAAQFQITGAPIVPETTPITLNQLGWYWLPYYRTTQMPTATALASISGKYLQIKSITGEVYQPPFATSLANLDPNKGYMIRMTATDGTLTYPANTIIKASSDNAVLANPKVFVRENNVTGKTAFIALDLNANDGDEVGVFTRDGMLVGSSVWQNGMRGVVVWGDDEFTQSKDGASEGEELTVKVWNAESKNIGGVSQIVLSDMTTNAKEYTLRYETDGVYFLKGAVEAESTTLTVTPQPATTEVMINLGRASESGVEVRLFNQAGKMMLEARENASNGVIKLNTSEMPSGVYQAMISIDGKVQTARVVIVK